MEAAAILAVVSQVLQDEAAQAAKPASVPRQSGWVLAWRPREIHAPLPSHTYDSAAWAENTEPDTSN
jgi:hypothetical protein